MSDFEEVKISFQVMTNKEETKVLFAQVNSDFADVLLSFLTLPLGTIMRLLKKHYGDKAPTFGGLTAPYNGVENLNTEQYFGTDAGKLMLLSPRSSSEDVCGKLKLNIDDTDPTKYFNCGNQDCAIASYISMYYGTGMCKCGRTENTGIRLSGSMTNVSNINGVFTEKESSFLMSDDLRMVPIVTRFIIQTLGNIGISISVLPTQMERSK